MLYCRKPPILFFPVPAPPALTGVETSARLPQSCTDPPQHRRAAPAFPRERRQEPPGPLAGFGHPSKEMEDEVVIPDPTRSPYAARALGTWRDKPLESVPGPSAPDETAWLFVATCSSQEHFWKLPRDKSSTCFPFNARIIGNLNENPVICFFENTFFFFSSSASSTPEPWACATLEPQKSKCFRNR